MERLGSADPNGEKVAERTWDCPCHAPARGWLHPELSSYTRSDGSNELSAAVLVLPLPDLVAIACLLTHAVTSSAGWMVAVDASLAWRLGSLKRSIVSGDPKCQPSPSVPEANGGKGRQRF